jgi:hypothetical protein
MWTIRPRHWRFRAQRRKAEIPRLVRATPPCSPFHGLYSTDVYVQGHGLVKPDLVADTGWLQQPADTVLRCARVSRTGR